MMLDWLPGGAAGPALIRSAVEQFFASSEERTPDLGGSLTTAELGSRIADLIAP